MKILDILNKITTLLGYVVKILDFFKKKNSPEKNNQLYNETLCNKDGDTKICDSIRKNKQKQIDKLKEACILLLVIFNVIVCGCINLPKEPTKEEVIDTLDIHQLQTQDITYRICKNESIKVYDDKKIKTYEFGTDWFIVHKDLLLKSNENQDYIIDKLSKTDKDSIYILIIGILLIGIFILWTRFKK